MLCRHVADVELQQPAVAAREVDDGRRIVGVNVDLDELGLADDQH